MRSSLERAASRETIKDRGRAASCVHSTVKNGKYADVDAKSLLPVRGPELRIYSCASI